MNDHDRWSDLAAGHALDALDPDESAAFERHLASCEQCRELVREHRAMVGALGAAVPPRTPPPGLRDAILKRARESRGSLPDAVPLPQIRRGARWSWLAAAALVVIASGALALYWTERARRVELERSIAAAESTLDETRARVAALDSLVDAILGPGVRTATLVSEGRPPSARLYHDPARGVVVLAAYDLPPAPGGRTYQLWGIADGQPVSIGTFDTETDTRTTVTLAAPAGLIFQLGAVTEEPAGGSAQPTSTPFLVGPLQGI